MGRFGSSRFLRVEVDPDGLDLPTITGGDSTNLTSKPDGTPVRETKSRRAIILSKGKSFKARVLSRVFAEDYDTTKNKILDPKGQTIHKWNMTFLVACLVSLFVDPLFYYLPIISGDSCIDMAFYLKIVLTIIRSVADVFYVIQIFMKFHTAYVAPSSRVLGRGELVIDSSKIALRYLSNGFLTDLIAALPFPQVLIWFIIPNIDGWGLLHMKNTLWLLIMIQYLPKVFLIFPIWWQIADAAGVVTQTAWTAAAYNLFLYMVGSHVSGACYYLLSLERIEDCWHSVCNLETSYCPDGFFDCRQVKDPRRVNWFLSTNISNQCNASMTGSSYQYGIYIGVVQLNVASSAFMNKYFYCFWWGLKNVSTIGQNLIPSIRVGENIFITIVGITGLILFALLIGNMQRYLQSTTKRLEEWKIKRADTEQWMHQRHLPIELRQSVRNYDQYKWLATRGVDEENIIQTIPVDLQRKVKRHLCFDLVRRVPLFDEMDETMLDAICERLKPTLCIQGICLVREGDPVKQMLFIIRGHLDSYSGNGHVNLCQIGPGDFCGEELLTWALDPRPRVAFPSSTRTVKATNEVEAFALLAEDLKFVALQFRRLNSKQLRHKFRFYSHQWRTWAACTIQVAWRRHRKFKEMGEPHEPGMPPPGSFWSLLAESLVASARWTTKHRKSAGSVSDAGSSIEKPEEPDFSDEEEWDNNTLKLASNT
ncbi:protein CNGC15b-like isoform X1 [Hevea brasiliensis]|uniref:protein CNGC15b-like isoform X1 n=1 Tax=Hevea brasiliensis TaxID=3981 RepID=UPI0025F8772F|nr:protein CNGC15b-like isoform X1 [Hevea brasiliensis]